MLHHQESNRWCYLFVHHKKIDIVREKLKFHFPTFVHKSIIYKRENKQIKKEERTTIAGLLFIQGEVKKIQLFLTENFPGLHLVKDCSTNAIATIPDKEMQSFMKISEIDPTRIRFMPHSFGYYSTGNTLVRLTSGPLAGFEGYRIRIARNKCLVTSLGGITVAISGIHKDCFENIDEYIQQKRMQIREKAQLCNTHLIGIQAEIEACFYMPQDQLDIIIIAKKLSYWVNKAKLLEVDGDYDGAVEIALFILEEIGIRYQSIYNNNEIGNFKELNSICYTADSILRSIFQNKEISTDLGEIIETQRQSIVIRFPFLPIGI